MNRTKKAKQWMYFLLLPYFKPYNVSIIPWLDGLYKIWKIFATAILISYLVKNGVRLTKATKSCFLFLGIWSMSFYLNNGNIKGHLQVILSIIGLYLFFAYVRGRHRYDELLSVIYNIGAIYIILHLITVIQDKPLFVDAVVEWQRYFLGYDNYAAFILLSLCGMMFAHDEKRFGHFRYKTWFLGICALCSFVIPFSVAATISFMIFLCALFFYDRFGWKKLISLKKAFTILTVFTSSIVMLKFDKYFIKITSMLGKNNLQYREVLWPYSVKAVKDSWIVGYGGLTEKQISGYLLGGLADHAHNFLLEILLMTGVIGTIVFFSYFYESLKRKKNNDKKGIQTLSICLSAYLLCGIFDFYIGSIYFYLLLAVIENTKYETIGKDRMG